MNAADRQMYRETCKEIMAPSQTGDDRAIVFGGRRGALERDTQAESQTNGQADRGRRYPIRN